MGWCGRKRTREQLKQVGGNKNTRSLVREESCFSPFQISHPLLKVERPARPVSWSNPAVRMLAMRLRSRVHGWCFTGVTSLFVRKKKFTKKKLDIIRKISISFWCDAFERFLRIFLYRSETSSCLIRLRATAWHEHRRPRKIALKAQRLEKYVPRLGELREKKIDSKREKLLKKKGS